MIQATLENPIQWDKLNIYEEVTKLMYQDGFNTIEQHGLWKLKAKLSREEWEAIKPLFHFYEKNKEQDNVKNMKYYGWATINPVEVIRTLYTMNTNLVNQNRKISNKKEVR